MATIANRCEAIHLEKVTNSSGQPTGEREVGCTSPQRFLVTFAMTGLEARVCRTHVRKYRQHNPRTDDDRMGRMVDAEHSANESVATVTEL